MAALDKAAPGKRDHETMANGCTKFVNLKKPFPHQGTVDQRAP
jgi:hypothetical protein